MKIDSKRPAPVGDGKKKRDKAKRKKSEGLGLFERVFGSTNTDSQKVEPVTASKEQELAQILKELDDLGRELALSKSMKALEDYTGRVKAILEDFQKNAFTEISLVGGNISGRAKEMHISRKINEELVEMTQIVMGQEKQNIDLAASVANIKGLLIDLHR